MSYRSDSNSRKLLLRLRDVLASPARRQERLDLITRLIAEAMETDVCSIYLFLDADTLELSATAGLEQSSVHRVRLRPGEGLIGRIGRTGQTMNTANAPCEKGFRYMPETGEGRFRGFLGVPIQRLGETLGVLVVLSMAEQKYSDDDIYALEVVAMVLAEMSELGGFAHDDNGERAAHRHPIMFQGASGQEGAADGHVWLHEPRVVITNPVADDPPREIKRLRAAVERLKGSVNDLLGVENLGKEQAQILETYRMFANSRGWLKRMESSILSGLSAEAAVEREQVAARNRMAQIQDGYLRERMHDLDDLSNRLLRILTGQGRDTGAEMPENPVLVARNIGAAELLGYGRKLTAIVLEEGSVGSHAAIVARALAIPLVIHASDVTIEALNGDRILVDGDRGVVHLRPEESVAGAFREKIAMQAKALNRYVSLRDLPAQGKCGRTVRLMMNAGLIAELPSLRKSGAEGVGLFRTELQLLVRSRMPKRAELATLYSRVMDAADGRPVVFRTLDIGSDKVLPYMKPNDEPNPAMGWRAIRVGLDKPGVLRVQAQALVRAAAGRPLSVMFPFIAEHSEFVEARSKFLHELDRERALGHSVPERIEIGAMCEMPSLVFAPDAFFEMTDFLSVGGNDMKQFFFAADRENERVRRRYDTLSGSFLRFLSIIVARCVNSGTRLSFCGEDAGRPLEALALAALGFDTLSMRPASIGPVKAMIRQVNLDEARKVIEASQKAGEESARAALIDWIRPQLDEDIPVEILLRDGPVQKLPG